MDLNGVKKRTGEVSNKQGWVVLLAMLRFVRIVGMNLITKSRGREYGNSIHIIGKQITVVRGYLESENERMVAMILSRSRITLLIVFHFFIIVPR